MNKPVDVLRTGALLLGFVSAMAFAAEDNKEKLNCRQPLETAPAAIRDVLATLYRIEPSPAQLSSAAKQLAGLVGEATFCRSYAQSGHLVTDRELALEWVSLHQWISRLADFVDSNARGVHRRNWKDEYRDFAELYEFDA